MIDTEDLEFLENVFSLQNNNYTDLNFLRSILSTMRDNPDLSSDIKDSFGRNQFAAKTMLIDMIDKSDCLDFNSEVVIFGCWYGSILIPKLSDRAKSILGVDLDEQVIHLAKNKFWKDNNKVKLVRGDVFTNFRKVYSTAKLFINTSCEHMPPMKDWPNWSKVRDDAYFAFQSNNMYGIEGHTNCVETIKDFKKQLPDHATVLYQEELTDSRGTRFSLVGRIWSDEAIQQRESIKLQAIVKKETESEARRIKKESVDEARKIKKEAESEARKIKKEAEEIKRQQARELEAELRQQKKLLEQQQREKEEIKMANYLTENSVLDKSQTKILEFIKGLSILDNSSEIVVFGCKNTVNLMTTLAEDIKRLSGFDNEDLLVRSLKNQVLEDYTNIEIIDADVITKNAKRFEDADLTVNTICEHMPPMNEWESWKRLKVGSHFVFQSNNATDKQGHVNCVNSIDELKAQLPANVEVLFEDKSDSEDGTTKFTVIAKILEV